MEKGSLVLALRGKEKNQYFVIYESEGNFVYILDGKRLKTSNPKKKNLKHVQNASKSKFPKDLLEDKNERTNCAIRKFLKEEKEKICQKMM